jgi:hypothetical protein
LGEPAQLIDDGHHVWVLGLPVSSTSDHLLVTEIDARTGAYVRELQLSDGVGPDQLVLHAVIALSEGHLFVLNSRSSINEYDAATGVHLADLGASKLGLREGMFALTSDNGRLFVAGANQLSVLSARTGQVLRTYTGRSYDFSSDDGSQTLVSGGGHLWSSRDASGPLGQTVYTLTEYNEATGSKLRVITASDLGLTVCLFNCVGISNGSLWLNGTLDRPGPDMRAVMQLSATTGALEATFDGPSYAFDLGSSSTNGPFVALGFYGSQAWGAEEASLTEWRA